MFVTKKKFLETTANLSAEVSFYKDRIYRKERWYSEVVELAARRVRELREELADARDELAGAEDELANVRAELSDSEDSAAYYLRECMALRDRLNGQP